MLLPQHQLRGYGRRILHILYDIWVGEVGQGTYFATVWEANGPAKAILRSERFVETSDYVDIRVNQRCLVYAKEKS